MRFRKIYDKEVQCISNGVRFCRNCRKVTKFELDEQSNHSRCVQCKKTGAYHKDNTTAIKAYLLGYKKGKRDARKKQKD